jgi:hypothetical protein
MVRGGGGDMVSVVQQLHLRMFTSGVVVCECGLLLGVEGTDVVLLAFIPGRRRVGVQ